MAQDAFDFSSLLDRRGMDATAIDALGTKPGVFPDAPAEGFSAIPMWIADMSFATAPAVTAALAKRLQHPCFGYFPPTQAYFDAIIRWQRPRHPYTDLSAACIGYENGVLGGVISALNVFCSRGDKVLVHAPTYVGFTNALSNNGYHIIHSPLRQDAQGVWRMDFEDMEQKLADERIHALLLCSPHNPCGRVWERWELEQTLALCEKYGVHVVSDEIWSDIIRPGYQHIPTQAVNEWGKQNTIALYAPSKTFNLAGLVGSYHIVYNPALRDRLVKESSLSHYNEMNVLSMHALIGAYSPEGRAWADALCRVLAENVDFACDYIASHFDGVEVFRPEATYMLFVDCGRWCHTHGTDMDTLLRAGQRVGVAWQDGRRFHGASHIRMNLALPMSLVQEAFSRLDRYVFNA